MSWLRMTMIFVLAAMVSGCAWFRNNEPAAQAQPEPAQMAQNPQEAVDRSGAIATNGVRADVIEQPRMPTARSVNEISPAVRDVVRPTTMPTADTSSGTTAQYMTLGAVVTEVSGTPIYADKVIQSLTPLLSSEAKQKDVQAFKAVARREIEKQVNVMIRTELEYAAAERNLAKEDKELAENLTMAWRQRQVTEAGGSQELARRKAAAEGMDFEDRIREQHRTYMVQIYYQRKVYPKVQITADDMRKFYDQHLKTDFTETDQARFRVIKIESQKMGGRDQAINKIKDLHERAERGDDFEKLAAAFNHDPALMKSGGRVGGGEGWVQKGAYAVGQIEEAVWTLQPGQVTDVIEIGNSFYIAKLEDRKLGRMRPFEDEAVQNQIRETLQRAQIAARREQVQQALMRDAVIYPYPPVLDPVMEMAMQKYGGWAGK